MDTVVLEDVILRDGLQMEARLFTLEEKIWLFNQLAKAGVKRVEVGSFVHPKVVPQMADTDELVEKISPPPDVLLTVLVLNPKGLERALARGLTHVNMSVSASDTHSRRNVNLPGEEALASMIRLVSKAKRGGLRVRAGVQCAFGCVYEGEVPEDRVIAAAKAMAEAGADELYLADTTGMGNPWQVRHLIRGLRELLPEQSLSLHLHDTRGLGLANMLAGYEEGVRMFDVCTGGLGGCPFVKGAAGNIPTEDAVNMFASMGVDTGIDILGICKVVEELESILGRQLPRRMARVLKATHVHD
jgi:hydroxymethylglutaryl-CoA lyase